MNMGKILKQAQKMQKDMDKLKDQLANEIIETTAGGGALKITITGDQVIKSVSIDPELVKDGDVEMLEDIVTAGINQALDESRKLSEEKMSSITAGLNLPGMGGGMGGFGF